MSIPFAKTKDTTLHLTTILDFGKYKDCRVDSIIDHDHEYIQYLKFNKIRTLAPSVLEKLANKFSASCIEVTEEKVMDAQANGWFNNQYHGFYDSLDDDIPF